MVGNIGRLSEQKGMEYYIRAIPLVLKECNNTFFLIIGEGEDRKKLETLVKELDIEEHVQLLGYRADIQNMMSQLDLVVLSSLWEGFPLTPIEAFSVGKTIVATAVDGTMEIVEHKKNGFLIKPKNEKELAKRIIFLYQNPKVRKEMEKNALESYENRLSYDKFAEKYIKYYNEKLYERTKRS